jgi:hypothetical protein
MDHHSKGILPKLALADIIAFAISGGLLFAQSREILKLGFGGMLAAILLMIIAVCGGLGIVAYLIAQALISLRNKKAPIHAPTADDLRNADALRAAREQTLQRKELTFDYLCRHNSREKACFQAGEFHITEDIVTGRRVENQYDEDRSTEYYVRGAATGWHQLDSEKEYRNADFGDKLYLVERGRGEQAIDPSVPKSVIRIYAGGAFQPADELEPYISRPYRELPSEQVQDPIERGWRSRVVENYQNKVDKRGGAITLAVILVICGVIYAFIMFSMMHEG